MRTEGLLLDTCAVIWSALESSMAPQAVDAISASLRERRVAVSPITAWELGLLAAKGKLPAAQEPINLFEEVMAVPGVALAALTPSMLVASSFLPGHLNNDPADRIIVATARTLDLVIVTRDKAILAYAKQGYVRALEC